jgi:nucleotide-binding universal stress UspA family protein
MFKTILVPVTGAEAGAPALAAALAVARQFDAHLDALHVKLDSAEMIASLSADGSGATLATGLIERLQEDADRQELRARGEFEDFCKRESLTIAATAQEAKGGVSAQFHVEVGSEAHWFGTYGRAADLTVAGRGVRDDLAVRSLMEEILLETGRPLLIPTASPPAAALSDAVAIAWKPVRHCVRAVAAAMPLLANAKRIVAMTVEEEREAASDEADRLVRNLAWHGLSASHQRLKPGADGAAETLLAAAKEEAGLLVMGGYGHSRLREWVFGGFTQRVLSDAPLPVLMVH